MKTILIPLSLLLISMISCQNEATIENRLEEIKMGDPGRMIVQVYDRWVEGEYNQEASFDLDIDEDGLGDFRITSELWGSPGMGVHPVARLSSLSPDKFFHTTFASDTSFYKYEADTVNEESDSQTQLYYVTTFNCRRMQSNDSIFSISTSKNINYLDSMAILSQTSTYGYQENGFVLSSSSYYSSENIPNITRDTTRIFITFRYNDCTIAPDNQAVYIGIKMPGDQTERLGWIKLLLANDYRIFLYETALQR